MKRIFWLAGIASAGLLTQTLSATVIGSLNEANCSGGGVTVTATSIVWSPAVVLGSTGCIDSGLGTSLTYSDGGTLGAGVAGTIADEPGSPPATFMIFTGTGAPSNTLDFVLTNNFALITPSSGYEGAGSTACSNAAGVSGDSCIAFAGSPFLLIDNGNGTTTVELFAGGTVADPNTPSQVSNWSGTFTTQLTGTALAVYNDICPTVSCLGSVQSTQSAQFSVVASAPEPGSMSMMILGGMLVMGALAKKVKKA